MGDRRWRDRENRHPAEQPFRETEGDVGTGGLEPCSAHHVPARGLRAALRVVSCRTATVWKTLSPFWGEEYQVHLPPTFHSVAFYVMDEDALRWAEPRSLPGARTPSPCPSLGLWVTLPPLYSLEGGGAPGDLQGAGLGCAASVPVRVGSLCSHPVTRACVHWAVCAWGCELGNRHLERRAGHVGGHTCKFMCRHMACAPERACQSVTGPALGSCK